MILSVLNELAYNLYIYVFRFLIRQKIRVGYYFINLMLPEIIFTVVTTLLLYRVFLILNRHLEEIGKRGDSAIV